MNVVLQRRWFLNAGIRVCGCFSGTATSESPRTLAIPGLAALLGLRPAVLASPGSDRPPAPFDVPEDRRSSVPREIGDFAQPLPPHPQSSLTSCAARFAPLAVLLVHRKTRSARLPSLRSLRSRRPRTLRGCLRLRRSKLRRGSPRTERLAPLVSRALSSENLRFSGSYGSVAPVDLAGSKIPLSHERASLFRTTSLRSAGLRSAHSRETRATAPSGVSADSTNSPGGAPEGADRSSQLTTQARLSGAKPRAASVSRAERAKRRESQPAQAEGRAGTSLGIAASSGRGLP